MILFEIIEKRTYFNIPHLRKIFSFHHTYFFLCPIISSRNRKKINNPIKKLSLFFIYFSLCHIFFKNLTKKEFIYTYHINNNVRDKEIEIIPE